MKYWLNAEKGEWGILDDGRPAGLRLEQVGAPEKPPSANTKKWVNRFVDLFGKQGSTQFIEDRDEFLFLVRCLEGLSGPPAFSSVPPAGAPTETKARFVA